MHYPSSTRNHRIRGGSVIEVTLLAPWIFFLFMGVFDLGFYSYALISTQNAARVAAAYTSKSSLTADDSAAACQYALLELHALSNVRGLSSCNAPPLVVTASLIPGPDGAAASAVLVKYTTNKLVPIPGIAGQLTITRTVQMKLK